MTGSGQWAVGSEEKTTDATPFGLLPIFWSSDNGNH